MSTCIEQILHIPQSQIDLVVSSQKKLLEQVAKLAAKRLNLCPEIDIYESLLARERLGSTCLGEGVAIPHCRLEHCTQPVGVLLRLSTPIHLDAPDNQPVDLVFALIVPKQATDEHLTILAELAKRFNQSNYRQNLRQANSIQDFYQQAIAPLNQ